MPVRLNSSGGGSVTLDVPSTAGTFTATVPANTGTIVTTGSTGVVTQAMFGAAVAGNGPAFGAFRTGNQTITAGVFNKVLLNSEEYDTNNNFDTTLARFTPTVAGYYQINGAAYLDAVITAALVSIYKNGAEIRRGSQIAPVSGALTTGLGVSSLIYMNGSTDFIELYAYMTVSSGTPTIIAGAALTYFNGFLARAA